MTIGQEISVRNVLLSIASLAHHGCKSQRVFPGGVSGRASRLAGNQPSRAALHRHRGDGRGQYSRHHGHPHHQEASHCYQLLCHVPGGSRLARRHLRHATCGRFTAHG